MDLYIRRHDNHAATIEDFVAAMQDASGVDLSRFKLWYAQAGTPEITVEDHWDETNHAYELNIAQKVPPTPGQPEKSPMLTPLAVGLLGQDGSELPTRLDGEAESRAGTRVLPLAAERESYRFVDLPMAPVPSLLRGFSAPVKLKGVPLDRLKFLAVHDPEPFARWEAGQEVATRALLGRIEALRQSAAPAPLDPDLVAAMRQTLADAARDPAFAAEALVLPSESFLADQMTVVDADAVHEARETARAEIGRALAGEFVAAYENLADPGPYRIDGASIGQAGVAQCQPRLHRRRRSRKGRGARKNAVRRRRQYDGCAGRSCGADRSRSAGAGGGIGAFFCAVVAGPAGDRQMVQPAGAVVIAGHPETSEGARRPSRLRPQKSEPRARIGGRVLSG